jgi:hypothetical protein
LPEQLNAATHFSGQNLWAENPGRKPVTPIRVYNLGRADEFSYKTMVAMRAAVFLALFASAAAFSAPSMAGLKLRQSKTGSYLRF